MGGLAIYEKVYNDTDKILGNPAYFDGVLVGRDKKISDEGLEELKVYAEQFLSEENKGLLRTILIVLKPYRNNSIIKPIFDKLVTRHKE